ncbi:MAG: hypothetical protein JRD05_01545 [Deltaproteobacteria bacterium]|nr:hypothetical protein [Deltaproteobacteria bacterium]
MANYQIVMWLYTGIAAYVLFIVIWNMFDQFSFWENVCAVFVIVPLLLRVCFIK